MSFKDAMEASKGVEAQAAAAKAAEPGMLESGIRGFSNAATFGLAPKISAGANALLGKVAPDIFGNESYDTRLKDYLAADKAAEAANPTTSLVASAVPNVIQAVGTGGGSLLRQAGTNAALGAVNAYGNSEATNPLNTDVATGAGTAGALSLVPGLIGKGIGKVADKVSSGTIRKGVTDVNTLIREKAPGYKDEAARRMGTTMADIKKGETTLKETRDAVKSIVDDPSPLSLQLRDEFTSPWIRDILKANTPSFGTVAKDAAKTVAYGGLGSAAGAAANYATGGNLDPTTAAAIGASAGAHRAGSDLFRHAGTKAAHRMSTSQIPEKVWNAAASRPVGAATQMGVQAASRDMSNEANTQNSPFGKLSDYLQAFETNDEKRKAAMDLQNDPEGRAIGNTDSPLRK